MDTANLIKDHSVELAKGARLVGVDVGRDPEDWYTTDKRSLMAYVTLSPRRRVLPWNKKYCDCSFCWPERDHTKVPRYVTYTHPSMVMSFLLTPRGTTTSLWYHSALWMSDSFLDGESSRMRFADPLLFNQDSVPTNSNAFRTLGTCRCCHGSTRISIRRRMHRRSDLEKTAKNDPESVYASVADIVSAGMNYYWRSGGNSDYPIYFGTSNAREMRAAEGYATLPRRPCAGSVTAAISNQNTPEDLVKKMAGRVPLVREIGMGGGWDQVPYIDPMYAKKGITISRSGTYHHADYDLSLSDKRTTNHELYQNSSLTSDCGVSVVPFTPISPARISGRKHKACKRCFG